MRKLLHICLFPIIAALMLSLSYLSSVSYFRGASLKIVCLELVGAASFFVLLLAITGIGTKVIAKVMQWIMQQIGYRVETIGYQLRWLVFICVTAAISYSAYQLQTNQASQLTTCIFFAALAVGSLMLAERILHMRFAIFAYAGIGLVLMTGYVLLMQQEPKQIDLYNQAIKAMNAGRSIEAIKLFDRSIEAYKEETARTQLQKLFLRAPKPELVARAYFHQASCYIRPPLQKGKEAYEALVKASVANPGNCYSNVSLQLLAVLYDDAKNTVHNLEKLYQGGGGGGGRAHGPGGDGAPGQNEQGEQRDRQPGGTAPGQQIRQEL